MLLVSPKSDRRRQQTGEFLPAELQRKPTVIYREKKKLKRLRQGCLDQSDMQMKNYVYPNHNMKMKTVFASL